MPYKNADCIRLNDLNIELVTENYSRFETGLPGRQDTPENTFLKIPLADLGIIARMFGFEFDPEYRLDHISWNAHQEYKKKLTGESHCVIDAGDYFVNVCKHVREYGAGEINGVHITSLEAEIIDHDTINIRITERGGDKSTTWESNMTYCGTFTVWWASL